MSHTTRVGIIGTGSVGSSVALSSLQAGIAQEVLLHDLRTERAEGEAMDLAHGAAFYPTAAVRTASINDLLETDAIVVAAGRGGRPQETRLDLLKDNARVIRSVAEQFQRYEGIVLIVTNPVDVLTYAFTKMSGLPPARVIGTGTMLDTARLRQALGTSLRIAPQSIHAHIVGEHGDSEVVLWSSATVAGIPLRARSGWSRDHEHQIATDVRTAAYEIIRRKGATNHAIGLVTAALLRAILRDEHRVLTVSRVQDGTLDIGGVALSLPTVVGRMGATEVLAPALDAEERHSLLRSQAVLREAIISAGL